MNRRLNLWLQSIIIILWEKSIPWIMVLVQYKSVGKPL